MTVVDTINFDPDFGINDQNELFVVYERRDAGDAKASSRSGNAASGSNGRLLWMRASDAGH